MPEILHLRILAKSLPAVESDLLEELHRKIDSMTEEVQSMKESNERVAVISQVFSDVGAALDIKKRKLAAKGINAGIQS